MDELTLVYHSIEEKMDAVVAHFEKELSSVTAGKASPRMVESILVDYYGQEVPISQVSSIAVPDAKTIIIQPWEKGMVEVVEKAVLDANLGFTPANMGDSVRINLPPMSQERRKELVKLVSKQTETARVGVRSVRKDGNDELKRLQKEGMAEDAVKDAEKHIQGMTATYIDKLNDLFKIKEQDILTI